MATKLNISAQQNLVTLLCHSDAHGKIIANLVDPQLFDGDYRIIATRVIEYWRQEHEAPKMHTGDLFDDIITDKESHKSGTYRRILQNMLQLSEGVNADYVLKQLSLFTRQQQIKDAIWKAAEIINRPGDRTLEEVEHILASIVHARDMNFDAGTTLNEIEPMLAHLKRKTREFPTGIRELDDRGIMPSRGALFLFIGPKGGGKSWFLIHCGKRALRVGHKVLHVSLEMDQEDVKARYWQSIYSIPQQDAEEIERVVLDFDTAGKQVLGFHHEMVPVEFNLSDPDEARLELMTRITDLEEEGIDLDNLIIKRFPNRSLTPEAFDGYLDSLEATRGFVPDMICFDYAKLMKIDFRDARRSIGDNMEKLRAIGARRNCAIVTADQLNRPGAKAKQSRSTDVAEDWSQVHTADIVTAYSATHDERQIGFGRLYVEHARAARDKFGVLLVQNYDIGQFCLGSALLPPNYFKEVLGDASGEQTGGEDDEADATDADNDQPRLHED